jgi:hypothetical protein
MNKHIAIQLKSKVDEVAKWYSNPNRSMNHNNETFVVDKIIPTSDHTASVIYLKPETGKKGIALFFYIARGSNKRWDYLFPTDSHITGFRAFEYHKLQVEEFNYDKNFLYSDHGK